MRDKIIEIILNNKSEFISGEELSKQLGVTCSYMETYESLKRRGI